MAKVIAITGASSGIGRATALRLAKDGAKVVLAARGEEKLVSTAAEIRRAGGDATTLVADVTRREDLQNLVDAACRSYGRLDVLVSSAGAMPIGPLDDLAVDDWMQMVDVNLKGVLFGIAAALPVFRAQGEGHFVNVASTAARKTTPNQAVYSATKAAVLALSDGLRQELAGKLRVTVISPGFTETNFIDHVREENLKSQMREAASKFAMSAEAVAAAIGYAVWQPPEINVGELVVRSIAQP